MIGDWVLNTEFGRNTHDCVEIIEPERVWLKNGNEYTPDCYINPIPLTDEILAKNFEVTDDAAYCKHYGYYNDFMEVDICEYTDGIWQVVVDEIEMSGLPTWKMYVENVHQLQHALRLSGIKKEIEL